MTRNKGNLVATRRAVIGVEAGTMVHVDTSFNRTLPTSRALSVVVCGKQGYPARDCSTRGLVCFECNEPGHLRRYCPELMKGQTGASSGSIARKDNPPRASGRAFQMGTKEARETADVVPGTFLVDSLPVYNLY